MLYNDSIAYMSIKVIHMNKIIDKTKNYEFRNYIPKNRINKIFVYVPTPIKILKYIMDVNEPIKYPKKIDENGIGNKEFNLGNKTKYAYPIEHVYELKEPLTLEELKKNYSFTAPQSFAYGTKYNELTVRINSIKTNKIF